MYKRKLNYDPHKFNNKQGLLLEVERQPCSKDRFYMNAPLIENMNYLDSHSITEYHDFSNIFFQNGLKAGDIKDFLVGFSRFYNSSPSIDNEHKIIWLKTRVCKQSNSCEKNVFLTRLIFQYESQVNDYLQIYLPEKIPKLQKQDKFIKEFNDMIQCVFNQSKVNENKDHIQINDKRIQNQVPNIINKIESIEQKTIKEIEQKAINEIENQESTFESEDGFFSDINSFEELNSDDYFHFFI